MRYSIILLLLVSTFTSTQLLAQSPDTVFIKQDVEFDDTLIYVTDTIIFESGMTKHMLIGTEKLPWTHNQLAAMGNGLYFEDVTFSACLGSAEEPRFEDKINHITETDSTLEVDITISDNCCYHFLCDIALDSSGTLNLIYYGYGTYCACDCCFGLTYRFKKEDYEDRIAVKAVVINGAATTVKYMK